LSSTPDLPQWLSDAIDSLAAGDVDGWTRIYTPDAVHEFPFAPEGNVRRLQGREEIAAYMAHLPERIRFGTFSDVRVREVGDELIIEADGHHHRVSDGTPFDLSYVWFMTLHDGRVSRWRDYMSPQRPGSK
jgi:uncharacterized protein